MKLSVISIAYNNLKGLQKTLQLFIELANPDIEVVVVDGGSKDGTLEYLKSLPRWVNWVSERDKGIYNAMNKGLQMAKGDYVWFLNSGDYTFSVESLNELIATLQMGPDAVYGETMMVSADGKHLGTRSEMSTRVLPDSLNHNSFRMGMNVSHQSFVIKWTLALPYEEKYKYVADIDWMIRCLKSCKEVVKMDGILSCFTLDGFSTANRKASNKERYQVLAKHYGTLSNLISHLKILSRKAFKMKKL